MSEDSRKTPRMGTALEKFTKGRAKKLLLELQPGYKRFEDIRAEVTRLLTGTNWRQAQQRERRAARQAEVRELYRYFMLLSELGNDSGVADEDYGRPANLTVSLTTIPYRIAQVHLTIESIFRQSIPADRVVLWLERDNFSEQSLPAALRKQRRRGLEIRYCEDLRSYKKLIPSLLEYPNDVIVTCDDDVFYPRRWLERLYQSWQAHPQDICCHRAHVIKFQGSGALAPYRDWQYDIRDVGGSSDLLFPTGIGGVLYYPGCFGSDGEVLKSEQFRRLSPNADDVWFKAMALRAGTKSRLVRSAVATDKGDVWENITTIPQTQEVALYRTNYFKDQNDVQLKAVLDEYDLWPRLRDAESVQAAQ